MNELNND